MEPIPALPTGDVVGDSTADVVVAVFEALYQAERDPMVRLALSMVDDPARAVEIVHDAFERLYLRWGRVREPGAYARCFVGSTTSTSASSTAGSWRARTASAVHPATISSARPAPPSGRQD